MLANNKNYVLRRMDCREHAVCYMAFDGRCTTTPRFGVRFIGKDLRKMTWNPDNREPVEV